jgi:hypothetical protein
MRNHDRPADHQPDRKDLVHLRIAHALLRAPDHVIGDAVVAPEHQRRHQAEHLLGLRVQRPRLVGPGVEIEESIGREIARREDLFVHRGAEPVELGERHGAVGERGRENIRRGSVPAFSIRW